MADRLQMKTSEGDLLPLWVEHIVNLTDDQRDILRDLVRERDGLKKLIIEAEAVLAESADRLSSCGLYEWAAQNADPLLKRIRAATKKAKNGR